jgi:hypothetical protein
MQSLTHTIAERSPRSINPPEEPRFMRRRLAGQYLKANYGFGSPNWLAKLASVGGGPKFHKAGAAALYTRADLDAWALARIGRAQVSTSDFGEAA